MIRNCSIDEISDGKEYGLHDMVRASCNDCKGCSACCRGMGKSIVLDPLDLYNLSRCFRMTFEEMLSDKIELGMVDGVILPNLMMTKDEDACVFLNKEGRCSIHPFRPGFCRIFPLGRYYKEDTFTYILQTNECKAENRSKIKVEKWIDTPSLKENQVFIKKWHDIIKRVQMKAATSNQDEVRKSLVMAMLNIFFVKEYNWNQDFYKQFDEREEQMNQVL